MAQQSLQVDVNDVGNRNNKKRIIIAVVALVVLLSAAVGGWLWFADSSEPPLTAPSAGSQPVQPSESMYVSLPQPFLFNLQNSSRSYLVQIKVQLQVRGAVAHEQARKHSPLLRDALLKTFSSADPEALRTAEGKDELRARSLLDVQAAMQTVSGHPQIERVLFTGFIMQ
ncbi:flagellar basal body-associated FliL family protein [Ferrimonas senticii]|uniref:flagellar basal body-associated FliL family protein n=1 Tax=Ferrimonas senticii TaxID=394566 RepID=UPI0004234C2D|nr:flagellar basal body-associated FliL family protein [Ferrimonas senticii]